MTAPASVDVNTPSRIATLEADETATILDRFDEHTAWELGTAIRERGLTHNAPIMIDVRRPGGAIMFRSVLPGATANHEDWIRRKVATVARFEESSALVGARLEADGHEPDTIPWLPTRDYALAGGGFPLRVAGAGMVAIASVSGLSAEEDHQLIVDALCELTRPTAA